MSLLDAVTEHLDPNTLGALAGQIGAEPGPTQNAIGAALPLLVGALAQNSAQPSGAAALFGALGRHDGSILGDLASALMSPSHSDTGLGILGHVLGGSQSRAADGVAQASGLSSDQSSKLLVLLAPIVLGVLGKLVSSGGHDASSMAGLLGGDHARVQEHAPGLLGALLDQNHDGNVTDDALRIGAGLLGGLFK